MASLTSSAPVPRTAIQKGMIEVVGEAIATGDSALLTRRLLLLLQRNFPQDLSIHILSIYHIGIPTLLFAVVGRPRPSVVLLR